MRRTIVLAAAVAVVLLAPSLAHAAAAGGAMPWDTGLQTLERDLTGPVPFMIGMIGFAVGGIVLIHGNDMGRFAQTLVYLLMVVSLMAAAPTAAAALGIAGAVVA